MRDERTAAERARDLLDEAADKAATTNLVRRNDPFTPDLSQPLAAIRDAVAATGAASLAVAEELAGVREVASDTTAVAEELAGVREVLEELVEAIRDLPTPEPVRPRRRRWLLGGGR